MKIILRADASEKVGVGHVTRLTSLGIQLLDRGHEVVFMTAMPGIHWVNELLLESGFEVIRVVQDSFDELALIALRPDWVVVDSYQIPSAQITKVNKTIPVLAIVDGDTRGIEATMFLDQTPFGNKINSQVVSQYLLGAEYCLLRKDLINFAFTKYLGDQLGKSILVMLGGTDATNSSTKVIETLVLLDFDFSIDLVLPSGISPPEQSKWGKAVRCHRSTSDVLYGIRKPHLVVSGTGTSSFEFLAMGVPVVGIALVENQLPNMSALSIMNIIMGVDWTSNRDSEELARVVSAIWNDNQKLQNMVSLGLELIDGDGVNRVISLLEEPLT